MSLSPKAGIELNVSLSPSGPTQCSVLVSYAPEPCPVIGREGWEEAEKATSGYGPGGAEGWLEPSPWRRHLTTSMARYHLTGTSRAKGETEMTMAKVCLVKEMGSNTKPGFHCVVFYRNDFVLIKNSKQKRPEVRRGDTRKPSVMVSHRLLQL